MISSKAKPSLDLRKRSVLGIETTCDETAAAVVTADKQILSSVLASQAATHDRYGGVIPEVAARAHLDKIEDVITQAMQESQITFAELSGIAVTAGPGLIGGIHVGVMVAKAIAAVHDLPFLAINHLAAHALTVRLTNDIDFPYLLLLVSGGHTQLLICEGPQKFRLLGSTIDDAVGEAFDKTARLMGLSYPGGPEIERLAANGHPQRFLLPLPLLKGHHAHSQVDFSFSGLKTAVRQTIDRLGVLNEETKADIAASFQYAVERILANRCQNALTLCQRQNIPITGLVIAGGVAANQKIRNTLEGVAHDFSVDLFVPPVTLCTDNAVMVAWAGVEKLRLGLIDPLDFEPRPRWPLEQL
jgi:N6-L-threonylcarbamoyladenine synthase